MSDNAYLKVGATLHGGAYLIERVLGQGGFGITYLAVHTLLKRKVAIKEFFPKTFCERDSDTSRVQPNSKSNAVTVDTLRNKFIKEATHIAKLKSPYIVGIIDVFEENSTAYYVMDYIEGDTLADIVKRNGPLPAKRAIGYISKIGDALTYVHSKRINHLDVKPANIMVRQEDNTPILVDFGLAKQYDSEGNQTSTTPVGMSHGYAPMEQYRDGGVKAFSPQTDLYSLAATLYFLLSGKVPPHASDVMEDGLVCPPSIPVDLVATLTKAMSPARKERHETVAEFVRELTGDEEATVVAQGKKPVKPTVAAAPPARKRRSKTAIAFSVIGALLVVAVVIGIFSSKSSHGADRLVDSMAAEAAVPVEVPEVKEEYGAPLSEGEVEDGRGGFDDNASGYFSMHADTYVTANRDVYFDGYFSDGKGRYPIMLKFEIDDDWFPGVCWYNNVDYNTKLKMAVRFTEEEMIITGNAGGSQFTMTFHPTSDGKWEGRAVNGNHNLTASIWPIHMP